MDNLIFDLGFHNGDDTDYYISKGYNVVAVEANPYLYEMGKYRFKKEIENNRLTLINTAFGDSSDEDIKFFIHPERSDLSTCDEGKIQYWNALPNAISVPTINYSSLILKFGVPYYIKCDIEGLDYLLIRQISGNLENRPEYLSFELSRFDYFKTFSYLYISGYTKFQLINQMALDKDGEYIFSNYSSGKFGKFLTCEWVDFDTCLTRYMKYKELKSIDNINLALGWVDIHASL